MEKFMFLVFALFSWRSISVAGQEVVYSALCENIGGTIWAKWTVNDTNNQYERIIATELNAYLRDTECLMVRDSADGHFKLDIGIGFDENGSPYQVYPVPDTVPGIQNDDAGCFLDFDTEPGFATFRFLAQSSIDLIQANTDQIIRSSCNLSLSEQVQENAPVEIESMLDLNNMSMIAAEAPGISCIIADETMLAALSGPVKLGDLIYITCTTTTSADASRVGFQMSNLRFGTNKEMTGFTIPMADENGCLSYDNKYTDAFINSDTNNNAVIQVNDTDFAYTTTNVPSNDQVVTTTSTIGPFVVNAIRGKSGDFQLRYMYIEFTYGFPCLNMNDWRCINQTENCKLTGNYKGNSDNYNTGLAVRKRRSDDNTSGELMLRIGVLPATAQVSDTGRFDTQDATPAPVVNECVAPTFYWMLAAILGVLLLLVIFVCVFLALRLRRERSYKETVFEREAHKNPAYN